VLAEELAPVEDAETTDVTVWVVPDIFSCHGSDKQIVW